jgi:uncharacterized protein YjbI with pentapeptide repeats
MGFFNWFSPPKPAPVVIIRNVLGEEIDRVEGVRDLWGGVDLRGRQWAHADLAGQWLDGANLEGANLFGARLVHTSFARCNLRNAELSFSNAYGANFRGSDMDGCLMYCSETKHARFDEAILSPTSDIPGKYVSRRCAVVY